jgi:hypothetical protein
VERSKSSLSSGYERKQERERIVDYEVSERGKRKERKVIKVTKTRSKE